MSNANPSSQVSSPIYLIECQRQITVLIQNRWLTSVVSDILLRPSSSHSHSLLSISLSRTPITLTIIPAVIPLSSPPPLSLSLSRTSSSSICLDRLHTYIPDQQLSESRLRYHQLTHSLNTSPHSKQQQHLKPSLRV